MEAMRNLLEIRVLFTLTLIIIMIARLTTLVLCRHNVSSFKLKWPRSQPHNECFQSDVNVQVFPFLTSADIEEQRNRLPEYLSVANANSLIDPISCGWKTTSTLPCT